MIDSPSLPEARARRQAVVADRVGCWRVGPGSVDRCRECVYLLRLEPATGPGSATHVVCSDDTQLE
jgi:hypothetical protein